MHSNLLMKNFSFQNRCEDILSLIEDKAKLHSEHSTFSFLLQEFSQNSAFLFLFYFGVQHVLAIWRVIEERKRSEAVESCSRSFMKIINYHMSLPQYHHLRIIFVM